MPFFWCIGVGMGSGLAIFLSTFFKGFILYFFEKWRRKRRSIVTAPATQEAVPLLEDLRSDQGR